MLQKFKAAIDQILQPPPIRKLMEAALYDAERHELDHNSAAEHHEALAMMYRGRIERLREMLGHDIKPLTGNSHLHFSDDLKGFKWKAE
jgi:hypothetical protein